MASHFDNVNTQAMQLTPEEKRALIENLLVSLDADPNAKERDIADAWREEIARFVAAIDRGEVAFVDGNEVFERIERRLAGRG